MNPSVSNGVSSFRDYSLFVCSHASLSGWFPTSNLRDQLFRERGAYIRRGYIYIYIYVCVCVYVCIYVYVYKHSETSDKFPWFISSSQLQTEEQLHYCYSRQMNSVVFSTYQGVTHYSSLLAFTWKIITWCLQEGMSILVGHLQGRLCHWDRPYRPVHHPFSTGRFLKWREPLLGLF